MARNIIYGLSLGLAFTAIGFSCSKNSDDTTAAAEKYLYIATGQCNSGEGITTLSSTLSSRMIAKVGLTSKNSDIVFDMAEAYQAGYLRQETGAQSIIDNGSNLLVLTENATLAGMGERQVLSIPKSSPYNTVTLANDVNAFSGTSAADVSRALVLDADDNLLFSESTTIEKLGTNNLRIPSGANAWIENPAAPCDNSTTNITAMALMPPFTNTSNGKLIYAHQGGTAATNKIGIISRDGYSVAGNCLDGQTIDSSLHVNDTGVTGAVVTVDAVNGASPTALVYIPTPSGPTTGKLLVAYSAANAANLNNGTTLNYAIVMYDVTETSDTVATIGNTGTILYREFSNIFGISAMTFDSDNNILYVATASQPGLANQATQAYGYKIEKFTLNLANSGVSPMLTLVRGTNNEPFIDRSSLTKCITSMAIGD